MRPLAIALLLLLAGCTSPATQQQQQLQQPDSAAPCARLQLAADPPVLRPNASSTITLTVTNCGARPLAVPPSGLCFDGLRVTMLGPSGRVLLDDSRFGPYDGAFWGVSHGGCMEYFMQNATPDPVRFTLAANESRSVAWTLNGSWTRRAWCAAGFGGVSPCDDPQMLSPGDYDLSASFDNATANATLAIAGPLPPRATTRLLMVQERDWLNGTGAPKEGDFGSHCAPARYQNGTLAFAFDEPTDEWAMLVDYGGGSHENSFTTGADGVRYRALTPDGGWLAAPWSNGTSVLQVTPLLDGRAFVNGTLLSPGESVTVRTEYEVPPFHATSIVVATLVGDVKIAAPIDPSLRCD